MVPSSNLGRGANEYLGGGMVDAPVLETGVRKDVRVRVSLRVQIVRWRKDYGAGIKTGALIIVVDALFLDDGRKQDFGTGSNPVLTTYWKVGEWLKPTDCKSVPIGYGGSNPSLPT